MGRRRVVLEFFKKQNKRRGLLSAWLFGFINLSVTMLHRGPKNKSPAEKRGLAHASLGCFGKFRAPLGFASEILRVLEKPLLRLCP